MEATGLSRSTVWRLERDDKFPGRVRLGANSVGWHADEVEKWVMGRSRVCDVLVEGEGTQP